MSPTPQARSGMAIAAMIAGADNYQRAYFKLYGADIALDGLLGPALLDVLLGVRELLKGELGNQSGAKLDGEILRIAQDAGYVLVP